MELSRAEMLARQKALDLLEKKLAKRELKLYKRKAKAGEKYPTVGIKGWEGTAAAAAGWCEGCVLEKIAHKGSFKAKAALAAVGVTKDKQFVTAGHGGHPHGGGHQH
jgi:hypothetical protein